jgi:hypothetical protein
MALAPCRECQASISTETATCPHCGVPHPHGAPVDISPKRGFGGGRAIMWFIVILVGGCVAAVMMSPTRTATTTSTSTRESRFVVKVEKESYDHGYLKLVGTVENTGTAAVFSPSLKIRVSRGGTVLAEDTVWPAGMMMKNVQPGARAAFESITRVPSEPGKITYEVSMKEAYKIEYPKR